MCNTSETASIQAKHSCTIFESSEAARQEIRDANSSVIGCENKHWKHYVHNRPRGRGEQKRKGLHAPWRAGLNTADMEQIYFLLHRGSYVTTAAKGVFISWGTEPFFHQKEVLQLLKNK